MTSTTKQSRIKKVLRQILVLAIYILVWFIVAKLVNQEILIPRPMSVLKSLIGLSKNMYFWMSIFTSILRILIGFAQALIVGILLAVLTVKSKILYDLSYPLISAIKATPVASFIILALFWFATGKMPIFICFLMVLPTVWTNIREGILSVDKELLEMTKAYDFSRIKRLKHLYIPSVLPFFRAAFVAGLGMAWKAGVAAEVIGKPAMSIGKELNNAKIYLEMPDMFAWTIVVIILSIVLEKLLVLFVSFLSKTYGGYRG